MSVNQQKTLRGPSDITGLHSSGRCIADADGKKVYIDFTIPGEEITYTLERRRQGFRYGQLVDLIQPAHQPFDMLPHTHHLETLLLLEHK
jgi:tRNA/tmRNA/rRNA uracil-C5-methylase (TrmA/RlmC/RlmD family)